MTRKLAKTKIISLFVVIAVIVVAIVVLPKLFGGSSASNSSQADSQVLPPRASFDVNKEFEFPVSKDANAKKIKFVIEKAQLQDEIVVKGQKARAVSGRTFLTLDVKIVNDMDKALTMNTRDYVRLSVNKNDSELLAPDIHNDPVEVQAISTKYTRLGFPVNVEDHDFVLQVGEIAGDKQKIELPFNK